MEFYICKECGCFLMNVKKCSNCGSNKIITREKMYENQKSSSCPSSISRHSSKKCWAVVTVEKLIIGKDMDEVYQRIDEIDKEEGLISLSVTTERE